MSDRLVHFINLLICFIHDKPSLHTELLQKGPAAFLLTSFLVRVMYLDESLDSVSVDVSSCLILLLVVYLVVVMVVVGAHFAIIDLVF